MSAVLDATHEPGLRCWVPGADGHADFPIQNLPLGVFSPPGEPPRGGIAIADRILDLGALSQSGLLEGEAGAACSACAEGRLNAFLSLGRGPRRALRRAVSAFLTRGSAEHPDLLREAAACRLHLPAEVGDYTDFYAGHHHALAVGRLFRPDNPLLPNYRWVPIGYHGRASSVRPSGAPVRRPCGQSKRPDEAVPRFGPTDRLDYELELAIWIGPGNTLGEPVPIGEAREHIAGYGLLNDWSARDIQAWEYQPLGPFLAKSFHTSVSAWIVTPEALAPFRAAQQAHAGGDPPLPYLTDAADQRSGALDIELEVLLTTALMRERGLPARKLALSSTLHMAWTPQQLVAHHASNGCDLRPGDLIGSGTLSGPTPEGCGSLLELTRNGQAPLVLPSGEERRFLEDGDEVILRGRARRQGFASIGFGECRAMVLPAADA